MVMQSHATTQDVAAGQATMTARSPAVVAEIDALVWSIATRIAQLPPARLLQRVWWEYATLVIGTSGTKTLHSDLPFASRMVDYTLSVIASVKPETYAPDVSDDEWDKLKADVADLSHRLTLEYQMCLIARWWTQDTSRQR